MHYLVDGYNLLFRILHKGEEVQVAREAMIEEISKKVNFTELKTTLIFDSKYQPGPASSHCDGFLEIIYTNEGETADDWIIKEAKRIPLKGHLKAQETVVTSDKRLAAQVRIKGVQTLACEDFLTYLNKKVRACINQAKQKELPLPPPPPSLKVKIPKTAAAHYEELFEKKLREEFPAPKTKAEPVVKPKKVSKKVDDKRSDESEMDRWTRLFGA